MAAKTINLIVVESYNARGQRVVQLCQQDGVLVAENNIDGKVSWFGEDYTVAPESGNPKVVPINRIILPAPPTPEPTGAEEGEPS